MPTYGFGSGSLFGTPLTDATGTAIANPSPQLFGVLQDVSVDISCDIKELYGQNQFPVAIGRGKGKITGKAKFARMNGSLLNSLFFGQTLSSGQYSVFADYTGAQIPATPYTITVTPPNSGTFGQDLGVRDANGNPMTRVASAPTTGQYSLAGAVYTFAAADTGKTVFISYNYSATSTVAKNMVVNNVQMGNAPTFQADLMVPYGGNQLALTLFSCVSTKLSFATKLDDFEVHELDFSAFANAAGQVFKFGTSE